VSLVELVIAIAIIGIAVTAIVWGMITSITVSGLHRQQATVDTLARNAAETVLDAKQAYQCSYTFTPPSGYQVSVQSIEFLQVDWNQDPGTPATTKTATACSDSTLERVTIVARSTDGQATESVQVMKMRG